MKRKALITGITGQDGSYLTELLLEKGYEVYGLVRRSSNDPLVRLDHLRGLFTVVLGNLLYAKTIRAAMEQVVPDEVYNLGAQSDVRASFDIPEETEDINFYGANYVVEEAMRVNPRVRIYQASTSEMFGVTLPPQTESSPFCPVSPYGKAKLKAHKIVVRGFREHCGLFVCSGILFNHESPRRGKNFLTRKVTHSMARVAMGMQEYFELGNLDAKRDWGFARDYVEAMCMMLQQDMPEDFVIATGESHTVREFVAEAAGALDLTIEWRGTGFSEVGWCQELQEAIVRINPKFYRPAEVHDLRGDATKAHERLGWYPKTSFSQLVEMMAEHDFQEIDQ